jgi:hypothetical protein
MFDDLAKLTPPELAAFYRRLADFVDQHRGQFKRSLAAELLRHWLDNRDPNSNYMFDMPEHLKNLDPIKDQFEFHRKVFLTKEKARKTKPVPFGTKPEPYYEWGGVIPRLQGTLSKWEFEKPNLLRYECLTTTPISYQYPLGSPEQEDLFYSLHNFQLTSYVKLIDEPLGNNKFKILFISWEADVSDIYDFEANKHIPIPNPDFRNPYNIKNPVSPSMPYITDFHKHAISLQDAGLAASYNLRSNPWTVTDAKLLAPDIVDITIPLR